MDQNSTKTVSLIVPNHNGGELFHRCMENLTRLQFPSNRLQVVIVDDGSTDGTGEWLESAEWPEHFEVVRHETNRGRSAARNTGLRKRSEEHTSELQSH